LVSEGAVSALLVEDRLSLVLDYEISSDSRADQVGAGIGEDCFYNVRCVFGFGVSASCSAILEYELYSLVVFG
jgi:hypothetical protein